MTHPTTLHEDQIVKVNTQQILKRTAQNYSNLGVLYEFFKNIEDRPNASFVTIEIDTKKREVLIYGDGQGADAQEMRRIIKNVSKSAKGDANFGLGLQSFLKFSSRMVFISKKNGDHYIFSETAHSDETTIYSDTGIPHEMDHGELVQYQEYTHKIHRQSNGTVYILEGVGAEQSYFNMDKEFEPSQIIKYLRTTCNSSLRNLRVSIIINGGLPDVVKAKDGSGVHCSFSVPSVKCPYSRSKVFTHEGKEFELSLHVTVWVGTKNSGRITIGERRGKIIQNEIPIDEAYKSSSKLRRGNSIFRFHPLSHYLEGHIYYSIYSKDSVETPSFYTLNRDHLILDNNFGDVLTNMLNAADSEVLRPLAIKKDKESSNKMDEKVNRKYEKMLSDFLQSTDFEFLHQNMGPVKTDQKRICPQCKEEMPLERTSVYYSSPIKIKKVFLVKKDGKEFYQCGFCKHEWEKLQRETSEERPKAPIYVPPTTQDETKDREKKRGRGYNVRLYDFGRNDSRLSLFIYPSTIEINTGHATYVSVKKSDVQHLRNFALICNEVVAHSEALKDKPFSERIKAFQEMYTAFCQRYDAVDLRTLQ